MNLRTEKPYNRGLTLLVMLIIYVSQETVLFGTNSNSTVSIIQYATLVTMLLIIVFRYGLSINKNAFLAVGILSMLSLLSAVLNSDFNSKYVYEWFLFLFALIFASAIPLKKFCCSYVTAIYYLAILSWIPYILNLFHIPIVNLFPTVVNKAGVRFHNLYIGVAVYDENWVSIKRNYGIFREPGVYQIFLLIALLLLISGMCYELFDDKKYRRVIIVLALTTISTFSTAGIVGLVLFVIIYLLNNVRRDKNSFADKFLVAVFFIIVVVVILNNESMYDLFFSKLYTRNASTIARSSSIITNISIGLTHPVFGAGWDGIKELFNTLTLQRFGLGVRDNANTFFKILAIHGVPFFVIWITGFYKCIKKIFNTQILCFMVFMCLIAITSNEDLTLNLLPILFVCYGFANQRMWDDQILEG